MKLKKFEDGSDEFEDAARSNQAENRQNGLHSESFCFVVLGADSQVLVRQLAADRGMGESEVLSEALRFYASGGKR